jgi:hypothetical protein
LWPIGKFCGHLVYFMVTYLVYFMGIWYILWIFGNFFYCYLVNCVAIWYILWPKGIINCYLVYILCLFGIFYVYLAYFMVIWYIFYGNLVNFIFVLASPEPPCCCKKPASIYSQFFSSVFFSKLLPFCCQSSPLKTHGVFVDHNL